MTTAMVEGLAPLATGFCFGQGPRWFEGLLWFSDMLGEAVHTVTAGGALTTLPLPGRAPSGLGFRPDGTLLIVSAQDRQLLAYDGETVSAVADLSALAPADLGDMAVDHVGRAYIGSRARAGGVILRVDPDGTVTVAATGLESPGGMVITPDHRRLIVAESIGHRLTAYSIDADGRLSDPRVFADGLDGPPGGICLDTGGGVWTAMTLAHQFERIVEGGGNGRVTHRIDIGDRVAIACTLGGSAARTLFMVSSSDAYPERLVGTRLSRIDTVIVDTAGVEGT